MTVLPEAAPAARLGHRLAVVLAGLGVCVVGAGVLAAGAALGGPAVLAGTALLQAGALAAWWRVVAPPGPVAVLCVAGGVAVAADVICYSGRSAAGLAGVLALGVVATIVAQLVRGVARTGVVEAFASTLALSACVVGFALLPVVLRRDGADPLLLVAAAAGAALVLARAADLVLVWPHVVDSVGRGALGVVVGTAAGAGAAVLCAGAQTGATVPDPPRAAVLGAVVALVAVLIDIGGACLVANVPGRRFGFGLGPMLALMSTAVLAYACLPWLLG